MPTQDSRLRQYLLGAVVTILGLVGSCEGKNLLDRISTLEAHDGEHKAGIAAIEQNLKDFRDSFEDFKQSDAQWKRDHDGPNRPNHK